jgi:hypothetical protein
MRREFAPNPAIRWQLICDEDSAEPVELLEDESGNGALGMRLALFRLRAPAAFSGDSDHALARAGSPLGLGIVQLALGGLSLLPLFAAEIRLIDLDDAAQQIVVVFHHVADAPAKEPSGLLADAKMFCQCLTLGNALARCGHEIEGRELLLQRQMRALEGRAMCDAELAVAGVAAQALARPNAPRQPLRNAGIPGHSASGRLQDAPSRLRHQESA